MSYLILVTIFITFFIGIAVVSLLLMVIGVFLMLRIMGE